jgi:hypothetical protein
MYQNKLVTICSILSKPEQSVSSICLQYVELVLREQAWIGS